MCKSRLARWGTTALPRHKCLSVTSVVRIILGLLCASIAIRLVLQPRKHLGSTLAGKLSTVLGNDLSNQPTVQTTVGYNNLNPESERHENASSQQNKQAASLQEVAEPFSQPSTPNSSHAVQPAVDAPSNGSMQTSFRQRPAWCDALMSNPRGSPMQRPCVRPVLSELCSDGAPAFFGQLNHDLYLWKYHWSLLKRTGVYLDLAANHAMHISNTYFLDRCLNWSGLCVEPHPRYFSELTTYRTCLLTKTCVSDKPENVRFLLYEGLSGIATTNKNMQDLQKMPTGVVSSIELTCTVVREVLRDARTTQIDYLSLDLEGHELKALHGVDWNITRISVISLEAPPNSEVGSFLISKGYRRHIPPAHIPLAFSVTGDEIYLAPWVTFGSPL